MGLNKKSAFLGKIFSFLSIIFFIFSCASIQKPQGGPRDRTPPKLVKATPPNMTRNFNAKQIRLEFDEFFTLKNQAAEISVSPAQEKTPNIHVSKKTIIVDFKDTLQKNTTYVINFGKSIADVNEGNILNNFTYVFSTGPHIDSLSVSGTVQNSLTGEKVKDATVMLMTPKQDTSIFGKKRPTIFATTDSAGNFSLNNLHTGDYYIYALKETAPNKIYDNDAELIAFLKSPIHLKKDTANVQLNLFKQEPEKLKMVSHQFEADGRMFFTFNKSLEDPSVKILYPPALDREKLVDFSKTKDTANVYMRNMDFDSIRVSFLQNGKPLDTIALHKLRHETYTRNFLLKYNTSIDNKLKPLNDLVITSNLPIQSFDQSLITLNEDSSNVSNYTLAQDTGNLKKLIVKYAWKQNTRYQLIFNEGALTDIYGDKNKKLLKIFQEDKPDNYGQLALKVIVPDTSKAYVIELLDDKKNIVHTDPITKNASLSYKNYPIGKYTVRVVYDTNRNGKWDSGNVKKKQYPENTWIYNKEITIRSNWDAEETITIPKEPFIP
ncbi:MAG: Ig-like domain-containing protein [Bacteroidetes bacterium]|nr:Ig-like domain-containing protein [Bacteroidota bacterium]